MYKNPVLASLLAMALAGCIDTRVESPTVPANSIWGSGRLVTESRPVSGVDEVLLNGAGELVIDHTGSESLSITAEDNILGEISSEVVGGRLILGPEPGVQFSTNQPILYRLTVRQIDGIALAGAGRIAASGVQADRFDAVLSGAGALVVAGAADHQTLTLSGAGRYEAGDLASQWAEVDISGAAHATIRASRRIEGVISGSAILEYYGNPEVAVTVSGSGVVRRIGD